MVATVAVAGQFEGGTGDPGTESWPKASGVAITRGNICNINAGTTPDSLQTCPTSGTGPFFWCEETAAIGTSAVSIKRNGRVVVKADGAGEPGTIVVSSATTAGRVQAIAGTPEASNRRVGTYVGHPNEKGGSNQPITAFANGEDIVIDLNAGVQ